MSAKYYRRHLVDNSVTKPSPYYQVVFSMKIDGVTSLIQQHAICELVKMGLTFH